MSALIEKIRQSVIGDRRVFTTAFGPRPLVYADYTASGRSLSFIEDYIRDEVLPYYANTHTETSFTGAQTTALREQARETIRRAVNGSAQDQVVFCGSGATAAINRLIDILNLRLPGDLAERYQLESLLPESERPVVFIGPYEHHSNELPWRESIADVVSIPLTACGQLDVECLKQQLARYADRELLIGSFSAASNVTGIITDVAGVTTLLHRHNALSFWDYAAAGPYVPIDLSGESGPDAVFLSPHKFVGGPGTPGVLIARNSLFTNSVPAMVGGGTVSWVTPDRHRYIEDLERREEAGTPAIIESIRAGLVFALRQEVGCEEIHARESSFVKRAMARLQQTPDVEVLGNCDLPRLPIFSLRFTHGGKDLHYGFIVALFNDLFGIQVRGGCSCAGPYGHSLLGLDADYSRALERAMNAGDTVLRPGWVRLNFTYFIAEEEFEFLLQAIELVAEHGWRLLPYYRFDVDTGVWRYKDAPRELSASLCPERLFSIAPAASQPTVTMGLCAVVREAREELLRDRSGEMAFDLDLPPDSETLRWFVLPQDVLPGLGPASAA